MRGSLQYIFALAISTCNMWMEAQNTLRYELSFNPDDFELLATQKGYYRVVAGQDTYYYLEDPGSPVLPVRNVNILVPNGAELVGFDFSTEYEIFELDILLEKVQTPIPFSLFESYQPADPVAFEGDFPVEVVKYSATHIQRGYTWFSLTCSPFKYNGKTRELSLVKKIILSVEYRMNEKQTSPVRPDHSVLHALEHSLINPEEIDHIYPPVEPEFLKSAMDPVDYLIVTTEELKPGFEPLLHWKIRKGLKAELITLEEISSRYEEPTLQLKIKRCLYEYYVRRNLRWALLGGDHDVVPIQKCYTELNIYGGELLVESVPTDLFYACFDNRFDWNGTNDDKIGQLHLDQHDLVPEISISRIPVSEMEQVRTFVRKTLTYEMDPPWNGFADKMLLSGIKAWNFWDGKSDSHHRSEHMFDKYIAKNWSGTKVNFFDTGTDYQGNEEYEITASSLIAELNKGYGIFHFAGHGNRKVLSMESGKGFHSSDALRLTNSFTGVMLSTACEVNAFDGPDPCLSESFLDNPHGGAIAFFASSSLGFGNPLMDARLGPSFLYNAGFLKNLFAPDKQNHGNSFANIAAMTKTDFAINGSCVGTYLYLLYAINPMGDPELPVFTSKPSQFDNVRIFRMDDGLTVNTGGIRNCRICITSQDLSDGYQRVVEGVSFFTFDSIPDPFQLTITAPNYLPYQYSSDPVSQSESNMRSRIRIYPNPASEFLIIEHDIREARFQLFDMQSRLLMEEDLISGFVRINLSGYPAGSYVVKILSGEGVVWFRFIHM